MHGTAGEYRAVIPPRSVANVNSEGVGPVGCATPTLKCDKPGVLKVTQGAPFSIRRGFQVEGSEPGMARCCRRPVRCWQAATSHEDPTCACLRTETRMGGLTHLDRKAY